MKALKEEIRQRIEESVEELEDSQSKYGGVYVAQIEESDGLNLEVEVDEGNIAFTIRVELGALQSHTPQEAYDVLVDCLEEEGINVYESHATWEAALED